MPIAQRVARTLKRNELTLVPPEIEKYLSGLDHDPHPLLDMIERYAATQSFRDGARIIPFPIVGRLVGKIIYQLALMNRAERVFELGSGFGYSAYWFAKAMGRRGELFLTDGSAENLVRAETFLSQIPDGPAIHCMEGDALASLSRTKGSFDIIFLDLDKSSYPEAYSRALKRIRRGGLLIADNTLWSGKVADVRVQDADTRGIRKFNKLIFSNPALVSTILPVRDGLAVCLKK